MKGDATTDSTAPQLAGGVNHNYEWAAFRFLPNGGTNLDPNKLWFLTWHGITANPASTTSVDNLNFFTLQIDPVSGNSKSYRPTVG